MIIVFATAATGPVFGRNAQLAVIPCWSDEGLVRAAADHGERDRGFATDADGHDLNTSAAFRAIEATLSGASRAMELAMELIE